MLLTLLAGPSTALRDDLVRCLTLRRPGLVAVVYEVVVGSGREQAGVVRHVVDASGTVQRVRLGLSGCCLSCTVREDVVPAVERLDAAGRWSEVVLALPASLGPGALVPWLEDSGVAVDTVTTVVDARLVLAQLSGDDLLHERGQAAAPGDRRSTAELVVGQLEDADVLAVADLHRLGTEQSRLVEALLAHLAPLAVPVLVGPGGAGCDDMVSTGHRAGRTSPQDRERLAVLAGGLCPPACGVTTVHWQSDRPLHSARLAEALAALLRGVVRSRGHVWLADRPAGLVRWESAGASLSFGDPVPWDAAPGCALALTGLGIDAAEVAARLDACLITPRELADGARWPDPFEAALGSSGRLPG